jgi:hypothetical protein
MCEGNCLIEGREADVALTVARDTVDATLRSISASTGGSYQGMGDVRRDSKYVVDAIGDGRL